MHLIVIFTELRSSFVYVTSIFWQRQRELWFQQVKNLMIIFSLDVNAYVAESCL